jgi:hypothetical protein
MTPTALLLFATLAHAGPPDRGESGLTVDAVPVQLSRRTQTSETPPAQAGAPPAEPVAETGDPAPEVVLRRAARPNRPVLAGPRLLRGLGRVGVGTGTPSADSGDRSDGIPPTGPVPLSR